METKAKIAERERKHGIPEYRNMMSEKFKAVAERRDPIILLRLKKSYQKSKYREANDAENQMEWKNLCQSETKAKMTGHIKERKQFVTQVDMLEFLGINRLKNGML